MEHRFGDIHRAYAKTHPWITFKFDTRDLAEIDWIRLGEAISKSDHIANVPLPPDLAAELHKVYLAKGIHGTVQIEGNSLSETQVRQRVDGDLPLPESQEYLGTEIDNILAACNLVGSDLAAGKDLQLTTERILEFNRLVLDGLPEEDGVVPGEIRTKGVEVGRVYQGPPAGDCLYLLDQLCAWLRQMNEDARQASPEVSRAISVVRAVLAHLYLAWIHPFGNGNGRTARLIEFQLLLESGFPTPACHLLSNYYNRTRTRYYQALNETSRAKGYPVRRFVSYAIQGFIELLREQLMVITGHVMNVIWVMVVNEFDLGQTEATRGRRRALLLALPPTELTPVSSLRTLSPVVAALYVGKTSKTLTRDVNCLRDAGLVLQEDKAIRPHYEQLFHFLPMRKSIEEEALTSVDVAHV